MESGELPIRVTTLRSLGNFKIAPVGAGFVRKISGIQKPPVVRAEEDRTGRGDGGDEGIHAYHAMHWFDNSWRVRGHGSLAFQGWHPGGRKYPSLRTKIDPEVIRLIKMRYNAVHSRVDALFLCGKKKQFRIKGEMDCSANLLSATGSCEFNLPTWWLPDRNETNGDGDVIGRGNGEGQDNDTGSDCSETAGSKDDEGRSGGEGYEENTSDDEDEDNRVLPTVGHLVFLVADFAPFVAAQLTGTRTTDEGIREVHLHWWSPRNKTVRDNASRYSNVEYGNHAFAADYYLLEEKEAA